MKLQYPDYTNCITNISCSILEYFHAKDVRHNTLPELDRVLEERNPRNVVFMLFDGMGTSILEEHLKADSFLRSRFVKTISSTFPPTTVAATTSANTGLYPNETGWLGWVTYFDEVKNNVITFFNTIQGTDSPASDENLAYTHMPFRTLSTQIKEADASVKCHCYAPFRLNPYDSITICDSVRSECDNIIQTTKESGKHFLYAYWADPDHMMHELGIHDKQITEIMLDIDSNIRRLKEELGDDTLVVITADHGHINSVWDFMTDYPELYELLERKHSIENRAASLWVKPGKEESFRNLFNRHFGEHFVLMEHDQILKSQLFGTGENHPRTEGFIGSFVAFSKDDHCLGDDPDDIELKGIHAGMTDEEMNIPLIIL